MDEVTHLLVIAVVRAALNQRLLRLQRIHLSLRRRFSAPGIGLHLKISSMPYSFIYVPNRCGNTLTPNCVLWRV